jgi:hypothetical protein
LFVIRAGVNGPRIFVQAGKASAAMAQPSASIRHSRVCHGFFGGLQIGEDVIGYLSQQGVRLGAEVIRNGGMHQ